MSEGELKDIVLEIEVKSVRCDAAAFEEFESFMTRLSTDAEYLDRFSVIKLVLFVQYANISLP